jgi:hypothetical protein
MEWTLVRASGLEFDDDKESGADAKEVQTLDGIGFGMKMTDSMGVDSAAKFLIKYATATLYVREAVVIKTRVLVGC